MKHLIVLPLALLLCISAFAERILKNDRAERTEVRYSQIGPRNTLLFYTFTDHTIKLVVRKHQVAGKFSLKAFEDQSGVFVKVAEK